MSVFQIHIFVLIAIFDSVLSHDFNHQKGLKIVGGRDVSAVEAPYMAYVKLFNETSELLSCGGSIIHEKFILTAAHCIPDNAKVALAIVGSEKPNVYQHLSVIAEKFICHEDYDPATKQNDICILKLYGPLPFDSRVQKVELPKEDVEFSGTYFGNVTGWGCEYEDATTVMSPSMRQVVIPILSYESCSLDDQDIVPDTMICGGIHGIKDSCQGDDGGPLVYKETQVGIVSHTARHHYLPNTIAITRFTKVSRYLSWILNVIEENS